MNRYYVLSVFIFLSVSCAFAQPEITQTDLLNLVNAKGIWEDSGTGDMPIDLKQAGPDQIWDFRNLNMGHPTSYEFALSSSKQSPYASKYPASDHVLINTLVSDPSFIVFSYLNIKPNRLHIVSRVIDNSGTRNYSYSHPEHYFPLPLTYGTAWQSTEVDTADHGAHGIFVYKIMYDNLIDAYGTVKLPAGDVTCLRMRSFCTDVSSPPDTLRFVEYTWIAKNNLYVAKAIGPYNDLNPNFTKASFFERFKSLQLPSGIARSTGLASEYQLKDNYPNPFNPSTAIEYRLPVSEHIRLDIYNISGQRIRTLQAGFQLAGQYKAVWDGTNESGGHAASGIYICRFTSETMILSKRMVLMK